MTFEERYSKFLGMEEYEKHICMCESIVHRSIQNASYLSNPYDHVKRERFWRESDLSNCELYVAYYIEVEHFLVTR